MSSMQELSSFPHYFCHWLRGYQITADVFEDMVDHVKETRIFPNTSFAEDEDSFASLRMMTLQRAVAPFLLGFLQVDTCDVEEAVVSLDYIKTMLSSFAKKDFMTDYMAGFHYLLRLLNRHFIISPTDLCPEPAYDADPNFEQDKLTEEYEKLGPKSKSIILAAHWMLNESIRNRKEEAVDNLRELLQLDPTNWVWHYLMCSRTRFLRRTHGANHDTRSHPWREEIEAAMNAVKHSGEHLSYKLISTAALSQCLAEIVRAKTGGRDFGPITITADKKYASLDDIVTVIKEAASDALMEISCGFPEYIRYGEILGIILPKPYRDYMVAAAFMKTACVLEPSNSKVNHKMGSIILGWKKDAKRAIKYLNCAVMTEPRNFPAWMDLLPAMLSDFTENEPKFERLFQIREKVDSEWNPNQRAAFAFYEGCVKFLGGFDMEGAITLWLESITTGEYNGFGELQRQSARCGWPRDHALTCENVLDAVDSYETKDIRDKPKSVDIIRLKEVIMKAKEEGRLFLEQQRRNSDRNGNSGGIGLRGNHTREFRMGYQPRIRNTNSTSDADNDNSWRRGSSGGQEGPGDHGRGLPEVQPFRNFGNVNDARGGRGGSGFGQNRNKSAFP